MYVDLFYTTHDLCEGCQLVLSKSVFIVFVTSFSVLCFEGAPYLFLIVTNRHYLPLGMTHLSQSKSRLRHGRRQSCLYPLNQSVLSSVLSLVLLPHLTFSQLFLSLTLASVYTKVSQPGVQDGFSVFCVALLYYHSQFILC